MNFTLIYQIVDKVIKADGKTFIFETDIFETKDTQLIELHIICIIEMLNNISSIDYKYLLYYNEHKFIIYRSDFIVKAKLTLEIPYGERSKYIDAIDKINKLVDDDGCLWICVDNNPYSLRSLVVLETNCNATEIKSIIKQNNITILFEKGTDEIVEEMKLRQWNIKAIPKMSKEELTSIFENMFAFAEKETLEEMGYILDTSFLKKKLFISYCHKDKDKVRDIIDKLHTAGLDVWFDEKEIDIGDNIISKISAGIRECDLAILFLSTNTLSAKMQHHEIQTYIDKIIYDKKKIAPVLLDTVNPDDIIEGLHGYNYFEYTDDSCFESLYDKIIRKLNKKLEKE